MIFSINMIINHNEFLFVYSSPLPKAGICITFHKGGCLCGTSNTVLKLKY